MTNQEKLNVLNSIAVVDYSASSGELEYVEVANSEENRMKLKSIGVPDFEVEANTEKEIIEISSIGFEFTDAVWFQGGIGFLLDVPSEEDEEEEEEAVSQS
ncbi:hypothetical protein J2T13_000844 [Paenibacillus sp. DS2015]|uniref:hypothetical protein n=1 Tax=Paenibacillus sp. DS2015 TaxID=3373917 RepID=UPI003D1A6FB8